MTDIGTTPRKAMGQSSGSRIIGVAMLVDERLYSLPRPNRHGNVIMHMALAGEDKGAISAAEQGFITDIGRFVGRREAMQIAKAAGQIRTTRVVDGITRTHEPVSDELYSEDLW